MTPKLLAQLRAALTDATLADLATELMTGRAIAWQGQRSVVVTQQDGTDLHYWAAAGDLAEILSFRPGIEAWARAQGLTHITLDGRKGWARVLKPFGYEAADGGLRKAL